MQFDWKKTHTVVGIKDPDTTMSIPIESGNGSDGWKEHREIRSGCFLKSHGLIETYSKLD